MNHFSFRKYNLTIKNQNYKIINKYGLLKLNYLKKTNKALYITLLMKNELTNYLISVSNECEERLNELMDNYIKVDERLSEKNKEINQKEEEIKILEAEMLKEENNTNYVKLKELEENVQKLNFEIEAKMKEWEELNSELERIENQN